MPLLQKFHLKSKVRLLFVCTYILPCLQLAAQIQQQNISVLSIIAEAPNDSAAVDSLLNTCRQKWKFAQFTQARLYADAALQIAQQAEYKNGIAEAHNQIGVVYWYVKDYDNALERHLTALKIYKEVNNLKGISSAYNRIGHAYADMPDYPHALDYFQRALSLDSSIHDTTGISRNLNLVGFVYMKLADYSRALEYYSSSLALAQKIKNVRSIAAVNHDIAEVYEKQNNPEIALTYALKGLNLALQVGESKLIEEAYDGLEKIYLRKKDFEKAYYTRLKFDEVAAVESNALQAGKIKQMQMEHEFETRQTRDRVIYEKEKELEEVKFRNQTTLMYAGFAGLMITVVLSLFIYRNYKKQRIANQKLKQTQEQLVKSEKMATYGLMASRLSHELLNPMNFINNFSDVSRDLADELSGTDDPEQKKEIARLIKESNVKINEHGQRASQIINQLQDHSNKGTAHEFFEEPDNSPPHS